MGIWDNLVGVFTGEPLKKAAEAKEAGIRQGLAAQTEGYGQGRNVLQDYYTKALQPYEGLEGAATGGYQAYADASGANGPEGLARARSNFQQSPGLDFATNRGIDALTRAGAARGGATGNTMQEALEFSHGLGLQDWGNYVNRLAPWLAEGRAVAGAQSGLATQFGPAIAGTYTGQGDAAARAYGAIGEAQGQGHQAGYLGGQNLWGLGLNLAGLAAGGMGGLGGTGSTLFKGLTGKSSLFGIPGQQGT